MQVKNKKAFYGQKIENTSSSDVQDWIVAEAPLQININGKPYTVTMRTPGNDIYLIRGLFHTENIFRKTQRLNISIEDDESIANIWIPPEDLLAGFSQNRSLISVSSCGICGKRALEDLKVTGDALKTDGVLDTGLVPKMFESMNQRQHTFIQTGGAHASACFTLGGKLIAMQEDIGRHNAVDKVVGELIEHDLLDQASCLTVSGRISYEIVTKCFMAQIPFLAAVSSPSSLAIESAEALGITLLAFCRGEIMTCYTHKNRLKSKSMEKVQF